MKALEFISWKAIKSRSLFLSFSFQVLAGLTILGLHLAIQTWYRNYLHSTNWVLTLFHFLLYAAKGLSSLISSWEADDSESKFNLARINLTHTLEAPSSHFQATLTFLSGLWIGSLSPTTGLQGPPVSGPPLSLEVVVLRNIKINLSLRESGRYIHSPVQSATRLAAYHIYGMWLVLSKT